MKLWRSNNSAYINCTKIANVFESELYGKHLHITKWEKKRWT